MNSQSFSLEPFASAGLLPHLTITGNIRRHANTLSISYALSGPLDEIVIPQPSDMPCRRNGLWEETCFEFFLGPKDSDQYWEFNLSPSGHWNVYRFKSYRMGMCEEPVFKSLPFIVEGLPDILNLSLEFDLDNLTSSEQALDIGISAVIKTRDDKLSYWALDHPGTQADFHRRDSFIVEL